MRKCRYSSLPLHASSIGLLFALVVSTGCVSLSKLPHAEVTDVILGKLYRYSGCFDTNGALHLVNAKGASRLARNRRNMRYVVIDDGKCVQDVRIPDTADTSEAWCTASSTTGVHILSWHNNGAFFAYDKSGNDWKKSVFALPKLLNSETVSCFCSPGGHVSVLAATQSSHDKKLFCRGFSGGWSEPRQIAFPDVGDGFRYVRMYGTDDEFEIVGLRTTADMPIKRPDDAGDMVTWGYKRLANVVLWNSKWPEAATDNIAVTNAWSIQGGFQGNGRMLFVLRRGDKDEPILTLIESDERSRNSALKHEDIIVPARTDKGKRRHISSSALVTDWLGRSAVFFSTFEFSEGAVLWGVVNENGKWQAPRKVNKELWWHGKFSYIKIMDAHVDRKSNQLSLALYAAPWGALRQITRPARIRVIKFLDGHL